MAIKLSNNDQWILRYFFDCGIFIESNNYEIKVIEKTNLSLFVGHYPHNGKPHSSAYIIWSDEYGFSQARVIFDVPEYHDLEIQEAKSNGNMIYLRISDREFFFPVSDFENGNEEDVEL